MTGGIATEDALIAACTTDDASLDVYADRLEERGHEDRCRFVRLWALWRRERASLPPNLLYDVTYHLRMLAAEYPSWTARMGFTLALGHTRSAAALRDNSGRLS